MTAEQVFPPVVYAPTLQPVGDGGEARLAMHRTADEEPARYPVTGDDIDPETSGRKGMKRRWIDPMDWRRFGVSGFRPSWSCRQAWTRSATVASVVCST